MGYDEVIAIICRGSPLGFVPVLQIQSLLSYFSSRAVGAFFRLEGHQFAAKAGSCWGSGGGAPGKNFRVSCPFFFWKLPSVNAEK